MGKNSRLTVRYITPRTNRFGLHQSNGQNNQMRFRFTVRDLLWLTALVAMGFGTSVAQHEAATVN